MSREEYSSEIEYSSRYSDEDYEYRHVRLPKELIHQIPTGRLLDEDEWRAVGIIQSRGWEHFLMHNPEPHIMLFRRPKNADNRTGKCPRNWKPPKSENLPSKKALSVLQQIKRDDSDQD